MIPPPRKKGGGQGQKGKVNPLFHDDGRRHTFRHPHRLGRLHPLRRDRSHCGRWRWFEADGRDLEHLAAVAVYVGVAGDCCAVDY